MSRQQEVEKMALKGMVKAGVEAAMIKENLTKVQWKDRINRAQLWHNPYNFDDGEELMNKYGWEYMFNHARVKEGLPASRFYFYFKNIDCTDWVEVAYAFYTCPNYVPYLKVWQKHAPDGMDSELYFLISLTAMTVRGMTHEKEVIESNGYTPASGADDYCNGIDAWDSNGQPVQIKSPGTLRAMMKL